VTATFGEQSEEIGKRQVATRRHPIKKIIIYSGFLNMFRDILQRRRKFFCNLIVQYRIFPEGLFSHITSEQTKSDETVPFKYMGEDTQKQQ
jgi:hypothetical protein